MTEAHATHELHPRLVVESVDDAIAFYRSVFDAELLERFVDANGIVVHAALRIGSSIFSMAEQVEKWKLLAPASTSGSPVLIHLTLPDPDAACARVVGRGGSVVVTLADRPYGKREGRIRDPFGHLWILSRPLVGEPEEEGRDR